MKSENSIQSDVHILIYLVDGVCRIEFNGYKICSCYPSPGSNAIQNLEIRVNLTATHNGYQSSNTSSIDLLNMWMTNITNSNGYRFRGICGDTLQGCAPAPKKYCKILFDCSPVFLRQTPTFEAYAQLKLLTSFETLEVEIASNSIPDSIHRMRVRSYAKGPDPRRQLPADSRATLDSIHAAQIARMALEPSLGEAEWVVGKRLYLQFHPRQHVLDQLTAAN